MQTANASGPRGIKGRFISGGVWVTLGFVVNAVASLALGVLLTRLLAPQDVGTYFLAFSVASTGGVILQLGMNRSVVRFTGRAASPQELAEARTTIFRTLGIAALATVLLLAVFGFGLGDRLFTLAFPHSQISTHILLLMFWTGAIAMRGLVAESFRGLHNIKMAALTERIAANILLIGSMVVIGLAGYISTYSHALYLSTAITALVAVLAGVKLVTTLQALPRGGVFDFRQYLRASLPLLISQTLVLVMNQSPLWILSAARPESEVAIFGTALRAALLTSMPLLVVNNVIMSSVAQLHSAQRHAELDRLLRLAVTLATIPATLVFAGFLLFGHDLLELLFGAHYRGGFTPLLLAAVGCLFNVYSGSAAVALTMSGNEPLVLRSTLLATLSSIIAGLLLIPTYGASGAAAAFSLGLVLYNFMLCWACRNKLGLTTFFTPRGLRLLLAALK